MQNATLGPAAELVNAVQRLSLARTVAEVQEVVRTAARRLTGADGATFVLRDEGRCFYADEDAIAPLWKGQRFPLEACISGWAMLNAEHVVIPDIYLDSRIPHDAYRPTFVKSLVMVPIRTLDPVGAIGNYWAEEHEATEEEIGLLRALADSTAVALENVRVWGELEDRVERRTSELQESMRSLRGLFDDLQATNARTGRLLRTLAHEVRNPLAAAHGLLELAVEDVDGSADPETVTDLRHARVAVAEGMRIVTEQLDLAKLDSEGATPRPADVDVDELLGGLRGLFRALVRTDAVELVLERDPAIPVVRTDPAMLGQVLRNLLSNALKFTDAGEVRVHVGPGAAPGEVALTVSDTGIGIAPEDQAKVLEEFGQVEGDHAGRADSTGLGLPLVKRLAVLLGGRLELVSERGKGSAFTVVLPAEVPAAA